MTARPRLAVRMMIRAVKLQLAEGQSLVGALESLLTSKWTGTVRDGRTVLSTQEAGGSVTFTFERGLTPVEIASMATEALEWLETQPDPDNPALGLRRYSRLQVAFRMQVP